MKAVIPLTVLLILTNGYLQYSIRNDNFWKYKYPEELREIIEKNQESYAPLYDFETRRGKCMEKDLDVPFKKNNLLGYCRFPPGKGNVSVMIIGNSYVLNFVDQIEESFKLNYSEFRYISIIAGYGTYVSNWKISQQAIEIQKKQVELHKPDVLFIMPRFTKRIYILDALPQFNENLFTLFLHYLVTRPQDIELLHLSKKLSDLDMKNIRKRLRMINCKKCQLFDLSHVFVEDNKYLTFNRDSMLSYIDNSVHLTTAGVALCEPILKNITKEILDNS
uniref:SGNH domain-containing protein n=1 Tax=Caenorhabditis tropicalis TaxID=1561998 RepID=A0A1I7UKA9_9PELO